MAGIMRDWWQYEPRRSMTRTRFVLTAAFLALALIAAGLHAGLGPPAGRINIRWADQASESDRVSAEAQLRLGGARSQQGRTWSYRLQNASRGNIERLVTHPLVADTHNIDRATFAVARDPSGTPEWIRAINRSPGIRRVNHLYLPFAAAFAIFGLVAGWPGVTRTVSVSPTRRALAGILLASLAFRVILAFSGGQFYWPDEIRYEQSRSIVEDVAAGKYGEAVVRLDTPDAPFFKLLGILPATVEYLVGDDSRIPGLFFSLFSVLNIWLVGRLARTLGASPGESLIAAGLLALSCSFFYYARHLFPYDVAMTLGLLAIDAGVASRTTARSSIACGVLSACAFYMYAGYWMLTAAALLIHALDGRNLRDAVRRMILSSLAAAAMIGAVFGASAAAGGRLLDLFGAYAGGINQGAFEEGWRVPVEYLWHAEHLLLIVWAAAVVYWLVTLRRALHTRRVRVALAGFVLIYGALVVSSTTLEVFVVYGRTARSLVPFLCLMTAAALEDMRTSSRETVRRLVPAVLALVIAQAAFNFWTPLRQSFPATFLEEADDAGHNETPGVRTIYTNHIYPAPEPFTLPAGYSVLQEAPHPLQYFPYQYEGYDPAQRRTLRSTDIRMRVIAPAP